MEDERYDEEQQQTIREANGPSDDTSAQSGDILDTWLSEYRKEERWTDSNTFETSLFNVLIAIVPAVERNSKLFLPIFWEFMDKYLQNFTHSKNTDQRAEKFMQIISKFKNGPSLSDSKRIESVFWRSFFVFSNCFF